MIHLYTLPACTTGTASRGLVGYRHQGCYPDHDWLAPEADDKKGKGEEHRRKAGNDCSNKKQKKMACPGKKLATGRDV